MADRRLDGATIAAVATCTVVIDRFTRAETREEATQFLQAQADALRDAFDRGMALHVEDGRVVAAVDGLLEGQSVASRPWYAGGLAGLFVGDVHRAVLLEKLLPVQPQPWRFVDIAVPVRAPGGRLQGVLGAHLSWAWAAQIERELVDRLLEQHSAEAYVVAADGAVLLGPPMGGRRAAEATDGSPLYREAELLRRAFDRHEARQAEDAARLRDLNASLEARVAERTEAWPAASAACARSPTTSRR